MGDKTLFWVDVWIGNEPLRIQFPNLYQLSSKKKTKIRDVYRTISGGTFWDWGWIRTPNSEEEKQETNILKERLQQQRMTETGDVWVWKNYEDQEFCSVAFVWRALDEKIPSVVALRNRGMNIQDVRCKICGAEDETAGHILLRCNLAKRIWEALSMWTRFPMLNTVDSVSKLLQLILESHRSRLVRKLLHAIAIQSMWIMWKNRIGRQRALQMIDEDIKDTTFQGVKSRSKFNTMTKQEWWDFNLNL
ncbi:uncharacterized protein LOC110919563 [Helianthus annuus]|uniref:uncharacterized protein LOC110919563 n=1 Tax=Helianthus annuus TaxID=4232 RepID=UPI000B906B17|nr:uncharacterized protein LOC110919563 [Helianthus annuus]